MISVVSFFSCFYNQQNIGIPYMDEFTFINPALCSGTYSIPSLLLIGLPNEFIVSPN